MALALDIKKELKKRRKNKMKKALLVSIRPEWAEKILNGKKTIEIRTWIPKGELPIEVLIYVTEGEQLERHWTKSLPLSKQFILYGNKVKKDRLSSPHCLNGKVVGKFTLNKTYKLINVGGLGIANLDVKQPEFDEIIKKTCLDINQIGKYIKGKDGHAWKIDDLEIFDEPKELGEYGLTKAPQKMVWAYIDEQPKLREPKVLNEETPREKNESERKPF